MLGPMPATISIDTAHGPLPMTTDEATELASRMRLRDQVLVEANVLLAQFDTVMDPAHAEDPERRLPTELTAAAIKLELAVEETPADPIVFTPVEREALYNELQALRIVETEDGPLLFADRLEALWSALRDDDLTGDAQDKPPSP
jgi:hypothetical protein